MPMMWPAVPCRRSGTTGKSQRDWQDQSGKAAAAVTVGGYAKRHDSRLARAQMLNNAFDESVLACGITSLDQHKDSVVALNEVLLQLDELDLQGMERFPVFAFTDASGPLLWFVCRLPLVMPMPRF